MSSIPGIFYRKPNPNEREFVVEGDFVKAGDTIGLVEVMKNFFEIKAEEDGIIEFFHVNNEQIIDAGQELAVIKISKETEI
ncbi:acetyl-CoA carboxylase [Tepidibacillus marianensis]|uniref:acetyl-CoA carboxylase n=1 Tax=Tepidibacillus marianensis TaxID=3131995 RepID=UPI0030CA7EAF